MHRRADSAEDVNARAHSHSFIHRSSIAVQLGKVGWMLVIIIANICFTHLLAKQTNRHCYCCMSIWIAYALFAYILFLSLRGSSFFLVSASTLLPASSVASQADVHLNFLQSLRFFFVSFFFGLSRLLLFILNLNSCYSFSFLVFVCSSSSKLVWLHFQFVFN